MIHVWPLRPPWAMGQTGVVLRKIATLAQGSLGFGRAWCAMLLPPIHYRCCHIRIASVTLPWPALRTSERGPPPPFADGGLDVHRTHCNHTQERLPESTTS